MSRRVCQTGFFAVLDDTENVLLSKQTKGLEDLSPLCSWMN